MNISFKEENMNIGILMTPTAQSGDLAEYARKVELLGFDSLWIPEHPVISVGHQTPFSRGDGQLPDYYNRWADPFIESVPLKTPAMADYNCPQLQRCYAASLISWEDRSDATADASRTPENQ
jgi:hypothetical protein